jgi:hypothetical protein
MRKALDALLAKRPKKLLLGASAPAQKEGRRGRPLALSDAELFHRRDQLQGIFAAHWPMIGWNLQRARKPIHIADALRPLAQLKHPTVELLLLDLSAKTRPDGVRPLQQEGKKLYSKLTEAEKRLSTANAKVMEARATFEQAHNRFAVARGGYAEARKKKKKEEARALLKESEKSSRLCDSVHAELKRQEESLKQCYEEIGEITKQIAESHGHFAQTELLGFVLSERYAFSPQTFANAAAGLPDMGWRTSMRRSSRVKCAAKTSINYLIFETVEIILEGADPMCAEEAASEILREISKRDRFESVREYLGENWPALEHAVLAVWNSSIHADARPYEIASKFLAALKAPRPVVNPLLDALEKDLPPT